ncbi:MAG: UDP-2,3-diacylglucosamine diphosphatase [Pseudomonadota bacterium]|nr:UDP-2,3-diacylglucosamine diphosphatase [Pseudomonadota bacterium]
MQNVHAIRGQHYRTVWISDVHLGSRGCQATFLLDFLKSVRCEKLYLVGDIIDTWALRRSFYWPQAHNDVLRAVLGAAKHDTEVIYVPGNHDAMFRDHVGTRFGNVEIRRHDIHQAADGRRYLVLHGDEFDSVVQYSQLVAMFGSKMYDTLLRLNQPVNFVRSVMGRPYWSLSAFVKSKVKEAVNYISDYEEAVAREAARFGIDGVICGHIHRAELSDIQGIRYGNCGDWVESCTALVEGHNGEVRLIDWSEVVRSGQGETMPRVA